MKLKLFPKLRLLSVYSLCTLHVIYAATETTTIKATPEVPTETPKPQERKLSSRCYIEKSKADHLLTVLNNTVQILNRDNQDILCDKDLKVIYVDTQDMIHCTDDQIARIQEDLVEVARISFKFATGKSVDWALLLDWDTKKLRLLEDLFALNVFYGSAPRKSSLVGIVNYPLGPLVRHLDGMLDNIFKTLITVPSSLRRNFATFPTSRPATSMPSLPTYPSVPAAAATAFDSTNSRQQYCTGDLSSSYERRRIFGLFEQQTEFLLNALESEMTLFARMVPNFKLVSKVFNGSSRNYEMDQQLYLTSPTQCKVNVSYFYEWDWDISQGIKVALQSDKRSYIRLPSEAATCVAILKVAHSGVSAVRAAVGNPISYAECAQLKSLQSVVSAVKRLVEQFGQQHWQQMTEPHKAHWKSIWSYSADLEDIVDCVKTTKYGSEYGFNCRFPDGLLIPEYETDVKADDDWDATWYASDVEEQRI